MIEYKDFSYDTKVTLIHLGINPGGRVQKYIDSEVLRLCNPMVPKDNGALIRSGELSTILGSGEVVYNTVYARRWYYEAAHFNEGPQRGNYWFERMKQQFAHSILAGAAREAQKGQ